MIRISLLFLIHCKVSQLSMENSWFFCVNKTTGRWSCNSVLCTCVMLVYSCQRLLVSLLLPMSPCRHHWAPMSPGHWSVYTMCCLLSALVCLWLPVLRAPARAHWADTGPACAQDWDTRDGSQTLHSANIASLDIYGGTMLIAASMANQELRGPGHNSLMIIM